ncbi:MAG: molecular chaperone DnaK [Bacteroidetes bacterium]|nr:MAG: molecular chaperone DnaK [Bacteroidota bacterium]
MKKRKLFFMVFLIIAVSAGGIMYAADHIDSPTVAGTAADITDVYVFRAQDPNNIVFVANTQGLLSPGATGAAKFDANTLIEFNIDNNNDNVEDLVIQCLYQNGKMKIYGPVKPAQTGPKSKLADDVSVQVEVTPYGSNPIIATGYGGIKAFAGPRDDPFFFDLDQFKKIIGGTESSFHNPGTDRFAGTNVLSVVVEVPKSMLGASSGKINVWLETKKKI